MPTYDANHMLMITIGYEDFENQDQILSATWTLLRKLCKDFPYMTLREGENAHPHWNPMSNNSDDPMRIWEIDIDIAGMVQAEDRFHNCISNVDYLLKPLNATFSIHYIDGVGSGTLWVGPKEYEEVYKKLLEDLDTAASAINAWRLASVNGERDMYDTHMKGTKLEKRIVKILEPLRKHRNKLF